MAYQFGLVVRRAMCGLFLTAGITGGATAQSRTVFAGEWVRADSAPPRTGGGGAANRRGDMGSTWGTPLTIAQSADSLVVTFTHFDTYDLQPRLHNAYALGNLESRNAIMIGHAESVQRSRVRWAGDTLVITTTYPAPPGPDGRPMPAEVRQALVLATPTTLVIETTRSGVPGAAPSIVRTTYARR